jgi:hypothetical protein
MTSKRKVQGSELDGSDDYNVKGSLFEKNPTRPPITMKGDGGILHRQQSHCLYIRHHCHVGLGSYQQVFLKFFCVNSEFSFVTLPLIYLFIGSM